SDLPGPVLLPAIDFARVPGGRVEGPRRGARQVPNMGRLDRARRLDRAAEPDPARVRDDHALLLAGPQAPRRILPPGLDLGRNDGGRDGDHARDQGKPTEPRSSSLRVQVARLLSSPTLFPTPGRRRV